jgi:hypothetical protein
MKTYTTQRGFTVIELLVVVVLFAATGTIFAFQWQDLHANFRDNQRKTATNAIHYNLEKVYHQKNGYYPEFINEDTMNTLDKGLLKDPEGRNIGTKDSDLRYEPVGCDDGKCSGYTLRAKLEKEAEFVKKNGDQ